MSVDLNGVTEDNIEEWRFRLAVIDKLINDGRSRLEIFTPEILQSFVGLTTNASNDKRNTWMTRMKKALIMDGRDAVRMMDAKRKKEEVTSD
jgi:hypothetical protein